MHKLLTLILSTWLALFHGGATLAKDISSSSGHHALWSLKGKHNTVYLLGSVHFLNPAEQLPPSIDDAYRDAEQLVMEIDMDDLDPQQTQQLMLELGTLPSGQSLQQQLSTPDYTAVNEQARKLGVDLTLLNRFQPWLAALTLMQLQLIKAGLDPNAGVEQRFVTRAAADHKPIRGLETLRTQFSFMANLPPQQQREFLLFSIEDSDRELREVDQLIAAWRQGDLKTLEKILTDGFDKFPDLYRPLTVERNRQWVPQLEALLNEQDDYLVIVGTLHLIGKESVIDLLQARGHQVIRR